MRDYGTGIWEGGDEGCDHVARFSTSALADSPASTRGGANKIPEARDHYRDVCGKCGARRVDQQIGLEPTPDQYVQRMVAVFREVRRVLAPHGTCWVNLGSSYSGSGPSGASYQSETTKAREGKTTDGSFRLSKTLAERGLTYADKKPIPAAGFKPKDMVPIPWMVAMALQQDGWYLRADIIWSKPNPMPESVTDRPTKSHEYVFLLTKQPKYFFDQEAVREKYEVGRNPDGIRTGDRYIHTDPAGMNNSVAGRGPDGRRETRVEGRDGSAQHRSGERWPDPGGRNVRSVWTIATQPYPEAHFATYPEELVRRCVLAGCPERVCRVCGKASERVIEVVAPDGRRAVMGARHAYDENGRPLMGDNMIDAGVRGSFNSSHKTLDRESVGWSDCGHNDWRPGTVLDPFVGSGTTCKVARDHGRHSIGIDLNETYLALAATRLQQLSLLTAEARPQPTSAATRQEGNPEQSAM